MQRKLIAILIAMAMLFSMFALVSCDDKEADEESKKEIVLTPKEEFLNTADAAKAYFTALSEVMGIESINTEIGDDKMLSSSLGLELKKLTMYEEELIEEPVKISGEVLVDPKTSISKGLLNFDAAGESIPIEFLFSKEALYVAIEEVTEKMLKIPVTNESEITEEDIKSIAEMADIYTDYFMDNLSDDMFTTETGNVTVDGLEIQNAKTITFKITEKQLGEVIVKVLEKAKADIQLANIASRFMTGESDKLAAYRDVIDEAINELNREDEDTDENDYLTISVVKENDVLRSIEFAVSEDGKDFLSAGITTIVKDGTYYVKGAVYVNGDGFTEEVKAIEFNYEVKANDKGSADGSLNFKINVNQLNQVEEASSGVETSQNIFAQEAEPNIEEHLEEYSEATATGVGGGMTALLLFQNISYTFSGEKQGNKTIIDAELELSQEYEGMKTSFPINIVTEYEKVSDTESKFSTNISFDIMGSQAEFVISGGNKILDYTAITLPSDDEVEITDENFDITSILAELEEKYPGIFEFFNSMSDVTDPGYYEETGSFLFTENNDIIYLYDSGTGYLGINLYNVTIEDGEYSAELINGTKITGTYTQDGYEGSIDGIEGYYIEGNNISSTIYNPDIGVNLQTNGTDYYLHMDFTYTMEDGKLDLQYLAGGTDSFDYVLGDGIISIDGIDFYVEEISYEDDYSYVE